MHIEFNLIAIDFVFEKTKLLTDKSRNESLRCHLVLRDRDNFSNFEKELDGCWRGRLEKCRAVFKLSRNYQKYAMQYFSRGNLLYFVVEKVTKSNRLTSNNCLSK